MRLLKTSILGIALSLSFTAVSVFGDATTSRGKTSVHASVSPKPRRRSCSRSTGYLGDYNGNAADDSIVVQVNGFDDVVQAQSAVLSSSARACQPCSGAFFCSVAGSWWVDLDAAEAAHPGLLVGQPLTIDVLAFSDMSKLVSASPSARMVKK